MSSPDIYRRERRLSWDRFVTDRVAADVKRFQARVASLRPSHALDARSAAWLIRDAEALRPRAVPRLPRAPRRVRRRARVPLAALPRPAGTRPPRRPQCSASAEVPTSCRWRSHAGSTSGSRSPSPHIARTAGGISVDGDRRRRLRRHRPRAGAGVDRVRARAAADARGRDRAARVRPRRQDGAPVRAPADGRSHRRPHVPDRLD